MSALSPLQGMADPAIVGFDAGWKIELFQEDDKHNPTGKAKEITRNQYYGEIKVETAATFKSPTFEIIIDGISDEDYNDIVQKAYVCVKIRLGWRDLGSGAAAPFKDFGKFMSGSAGDDSNYHDVINGRIKTFERTAGEFRYRTKFTGVDYRWEQLRAKKATKLDVKKGDPIGKYATLLAGQVGVPITVHPDGKAGEPVDEIINLPKDATISAALTHIARVGHSEGADKRIPMFLRTDGLHFGAWMAPVTKAAKSKKLDISSGLVETKPVVDADPDAVFPVVFKPPTVLKYDLTLKGRADIQVGDKVEVSVDVPKPDPKKKDFGAAVGGIGDIIQGIGQAFGVQPEPTFDPFRVIAVKHELDRSKGFVTTMRIESQPPDEKPSSRAESVSKGAQNTIDEAAKTAAALVVQANQKMREVEGLDIGEVNAQFIEPGKNGSHDVAAQRVEIQEGIKGDGQGNSTVRMDRSDTPTQLFNKPYLTPFAFGSTGLVIPHYPGTRVADLHHRNDVSQTMVAGCLWRDGKEPKSKFGDWWLSLPTGVEEVKSIEDTRKAKAPSGPASHDLIDKDGARAIHVRGFRISVGEGKLPDVGTRPSDPPKDELLIEHKSGAQIRIDSNGNIEIKSPENLTLDAKKIVLKTQTEVDVQ
jgi:hypothetical protein